MDGIKFAKQYVIDNSKRKRPLFELDEKIKNNAICTIKIKDATSYILGDITVEKAVGSEFQNASGLTNKQLHNCAVIYAPKLTDISEFEKLAPLFCYFALRQARIWGCQNIIFCGINDDNNSKYMQTIMKLSPLKHCLNVDINKTYNVFAERIKYSIINVYSSCDEVFLSFIRSEFISEILSIFEIWCKELFTQSWFTAVHSRTISKEQYITSLYNLHQFVRHTTRLAARCVASSENRDLRNHYIYHLKGEVNHEIIIESDLKGLNADLEYLMNHHVAHTATSEFIVVQESIIGFKQDPVMMLACPFIAEGMTANIDSSFVDNLHHSIKNWGIENPEQVSRFLTSHMKTDGGVDGHWLRVVMMTDQFINSEHELQHFICLMRLAQKAYANGLNANIDDLELWRPDINVKVGQHC